MFRSRKKEGGTTRRRVELSQSTAPTAAAAALAASPPRSGDGQTNGFSGFHTGADTGVDTGAAKERDGRSLTSSTHDVSTYDVNGKEEKRRRRTARLLEGVDPCQQTLGRPGTVQNGDKRARLKRNAVSRIETETQTDVDHRAVLERNLAIGEKLLAGELQSGIYRGEGALRPVKPMSMDKIRAGKASGLYGPVRGSQYARTTLGVDYNPEVCKDYKETGYCTFGDTCKFIHDRSTYKSGWQLDRDFARHQKALQGKEAGKTTICRAEKGGVPTAVSRTEGDDPFDSESEDRKEATGLTAESLRRKRPLKSDPLSHSSSPSSSELSDSDS